MCYSLLLLFCVAWAQQSCEWTRGHKVFWYEYVMIHRTQSAKNLLTNTDDEVTKLNVP